ncbi:MAG: DNA polymerase IV [Gammaproteobacteria bacterium]|nr:DNA polymerase IV [Gammaproteobacteria bacterium]
MSAFSPLRWPRAVALIDMNAFFASIEQRDFPELQGRPVGVTNGMTGTCIITSSYEARRRGIQTGMRVKQARRLCPEFVQRPARPERYAQVSTAIMQALQEITPQVEVFSVDEAFLELTDCQDAFGTPVAMARRARNVVFRVSGLQCSIGVSGDKTTAKHAAKLHKPDGFTVIPPWEARARLHHVPLTQLCGIKQGIGGFLAQRGIHTCGDMQRLPISVLAQRFGNPGRRIWLMAQGLDPEPVHTTVPPPKSIGHGKIMPPATRDRRVLATYLLHMAQKVGARLRQHQLQAQTFFIGLLSDGGYVAHKFRSVRATDDSREIYALCKDYLARYWSGWGAHQVQVTALDPRPADVQQDLFFHRDERLARLNTVMDAVNARYGEFTLAPAPLLLRSNMPNVIAPAWKPYGHRQTI